MIYLLIVMASFSNQKNFLQAIEFHYTFCMNKNIQFIIKYILHFYIVQVAYWVSRN